MRITYLVERLGPYHEYRLSGIKDHDLQIIETRPDSLRYAWKEENSLKTMSLDSELGYSDLWKMIAETNPEVIFISGYGFREMLWGKAWAVRNSVPIVMLSDTTVQDEPKYLIKERIKSFILSHVETALVAGRASRAYLNSLGFENDRIFEPYDIIDNNFYEIKEEGRPFSEPYFLSISRLIPYKNLDFLIDTFTEFFKSLKDPIHLIILGHGELKDALLKKIQSNGMEKFIHLKGFLINTKVRAYYQSAIALVLVSKSEAWGLCINEAMAAGIPVIATEIAGATKDLIEEDITGYSFSPTNSGQLIGLMKKVHAFSTEKRADMIEKAKIKLKKFGLPEFIQGFNKAAELALSLKKERPLKDIRSKILLEISKRAF